MCHRRIRYRRRSARLRCPRGSTGSVDHVRLPAPLDPAAAFAKDWLHLNLFDHASGTVGLINASMHGNPSTATAIVVGSALFHDPRVGAGLGGRTSSRLGPPSSTSPVLASERSASCSQKTVAWPFRWPAPELRRR